MVATVAAGTSARYYLSLTGYYTASGESRGQWVRVGLKAGFASGEAVKDADFEKLHAGLDQEGRPLLSNSGGKAARVGGYDLTFSAPKSISLRWALADEPLRAEFERAHTAAVDAALDALENNAAFCRFGKAGIRREKTHLTGAAFLHGDARPAAHSDGAVFSDPDLHTHVVVLNIGPKGADQFGALDGKAIFNWKMAVGACYHLALATELQKLGLSIESLGKNGIFEIGGIDRRLIDYFSARRNAIVAELGKAGRDSREAPALAAEITRATRKAKRDRGDEDRFDSWRKRAAALGFVPGKIQAQAFSAGGASAAGASSELDREELIKARIDAVPCQLTEHESTFERRTLYAAIAAALVGTGASSDRIDREIDRLTASEQVVTLDRDDWGHPILTTQEMLTIEREIGALASSLGVPRDAASGEVAVERFITEKTLNGEQINAIRAATRGDGISVIEGAPGSGKSTTLSPICRAWQTAGYRVIGAATAWKVAHALRDDLGIEARAIDAWLTGAAGGGHFLDEKTVLVVDEAGLLSSRQMHSLLSAVDKATLLGRPNAPRLIFVGDRNQLQSVGAGSGLRLVAAALSVNAVEQIQRQREPWLRDAIVAFGKGDAAPAIAAFESHGCVRLAGNSKQAVGELVDRWERVATERPDARTIMIARTNAEVRAISDEARVRLRRRGKIAGEDVALKAVTPSGKAVDLRLAAGDKVRFLTRARLPGLEVINGTEATLTLAEHDVAGKVKLVAQFGDKQVAFGPEDVADAQGRSRIAHAYATTVYGSQGMTVEQAFVLLSPAFDRHAIYVASSRARDRTEFFVDGDDLKSRMRAELPLSERATAPEFDEQARMAFLGRQIARPGLKLTTLDVVNSAAERVKRLEGHEAPKLTSTLEKSPLVVRRGRGLTLD